MSSRIVCYQDYVAGWLDSSIHDFLQAFPPISKSMSYALITCLDSTLDPAPLNAFQPLPAISSIRTIRLFILSAT